MPQASQTIDPKAPPIHALVVCALPVLAGLLAVAVTQHPTWALLAVVLMAVACALAKWPEASTLTVVFVLYTNIPAIAVEFHGVPFIVSGSFLLLLCIPLFGHLVSNREKIVIRPELVLLTLFVMVQAVGAVFSSHPDAAAGELRTSLTEGLVLYFLILNAVRTQQTLQRVIWTLLAAGVLMSVVPLYQQLTGSYDNSFYGFGQVSNAAFEIEPGMKAAEMQRRLAGSVGEQNRFAQVLLMLFPLGLMRTVGESSARLRLMAALATALILGAIVLTFSRGAAIGLVVVLIAAVGFGYLPLRRLSFVPVLVVVVLAAFPQYGTRIAKLQGLWGLVDPQIRADEAKPDGSIKSRITEMGAAGLAFLDYPLVGVGPGNFKFHYREYAEQIGLRVFAKGRRSHSIFPGIAAENGFLGLMLFGSIIALTLRDLLTANRRWRTVNPARANLTASFFLVVVAYMTTAMFLHLAYVRFLWLMMALAGAAIHMRDERSTARMPSPQVQA